MYNRLKINALLFFLFFPINVWAWECEVFIAGPNVIKKGQTITLTAQGAPEGGSYSWSNTNNLVANGSSATLTADQAPEYSEYIQVRVKYSSPRGKICSATKYVWFCRCYTKISGPDKYRIEESPIQLSASGDPPGGTFEWTPAHGLTADGDSAEFKSETLGQETLSVYYTPPGETEPCEATHKIEVVEQCAVSIAGDTAVRENKRITLTATGVPEGGTYEWQKIEGLSDDDGNTAEFKGQTPGLVDIEVTYTPEDSDKGCTANHNVEVQEECLIKIEAPKLTINVGETITLNAVGNPEGGKFYWPSLAELVNHGQTADFTGMEPGDFTIELAYQPDDGGVPCISEPLVVTVIQECHITIMGPSETKIGQTISFQVLTDEGEEGGGTIQWIEEPGLVANGNTAEFTGQYAGQITIGVIYTPPGSKKSCPLIEHKITVIEECSVILSGPSEIDFGETAEYQAFGSSEGGIYVWYGPPNLEVNYNKAKFAGLVAGTKAISVSYRPESGGSEDNTIRDLTATKENNIEQCTDTKIVTVTSIC